MPRPTNGYLSNQPYNPSVVPRSYRHSSDESETDGNGGGGGPYGQPTANDGYGAHSATISHGHVLPPLRQNHGQQAHATRVARAPTDHAINNYNFSGIPGPHDSSYQLNSITHSGHFHGTQPQLPPLPPHAGDYYPTQPDSSPWNTPNQFQTHQLTTALYSDEQNVLGGTAGHTRHGSTRLPPQVHPGFPPSQTQYWQQTSHSGSPPYSSSPSPSTDGSYAFGNDHSPSHVPLSLNSNDTEGPGKTMEEHLREECGFRLGQPLSLWSLPDPLPGGKPNFKLKCAAALAIYESRHKRLTLQEIYKAMEERFTFFRNQPLVDGKLTWHGSVRHMLSLESIFVNDTRPIAEPGKGGYWSLTTANGFGRKRLRKRLKRDQKQAKRRAKEEESQLDYDGSYDDFFDDQQIGPSSGVQRSSKSSRYSSSPQLSPTSLLGRPMSNSPGPYDSMVVFGQPSLQPLGYQYARPPGPSRTHSLPNGPADYGSTQEDVGRNLRYHDLRHASSQGDMQVDDNDGPGGARASRRVAEKGKRRAF